MTIEMLEIKQDYEAEEGITGDRRWIAVVMSPTGDRIIAQSGWQEFPHFGSMERYAQEFDSDRMILLGKLLGDGWEPVGTDQHGQVVTMKRIIQ